ncbi:transmembrane glycoprotein NMB [Spea bombifrons]|uniref:transmembrane glycoprotein NMB n=1 Tax=Spea bombifrons TaxID=233779 RepID=UPI00234923EB|nr:transmembrane glycoprotein NMB [Spea bombifrons]
MKAMGLGSVVALILCLGSGIQAVTRYQDVMVLGSRSGHTGNHNQIRGWSPGSNSWDEMLYPAWKAGDSRWENCWKGGKVVALLTSNSPALIGSNVTFAVTLQFPRCQRANDDGDIVYDRRCRNDTANYQDQYVYNWTKWVDYCDQGNCSFISKFPDGRPFPQRHDWRRRNFVYVFHTLGQYYQQLGGPWTTLSLNTTNITAGTQMMEVSVYRRGHRRCYPVAKASDIYVVTDEIPFYVNISQKNDRSSSDKIFIKDSPIKFDVQLHDPSHYLDDAVVTFNWSFGDGNGSLISNDPDIKHTYNVLGNYSLKLTVKAAIPGPCNPVTPTPLVPTTHSTSTAHTTSNSTSNGTEFPPADTTFPFTTEGPNLTTYSTLTTTPVPTEAPGCFIYRYGHYETNLTIVDGILDVNIIQMTDVQVSASLAQDSFIDFVVSCQGSLPKDACTVISDYTCMVPQGMVCDKVNASDQCLVTLRRSFAEPGTYCVNITLRDDASVALASTLVSVNGFRPQRNIEAILIPLGLVVIVAAVIGAILFKKYKEYKPIGNAADQHADEGIRVYFNQIKSGLFKENAENDPLLKNKARII